MLLRLFFLIMILFFIALNSQADNLLHFQWSPYPENEADGFRLYIDDDINIIRDNIPITDTTLSIEKLSEGGCHEYFIRAFRGKEESLDSDHVEVCVPATPQEFKILNITEVK